MNTSVYLEDGTLLFQMPSFGRALNEGDVFTCTLPGEAPVTYKVESVEYVLEASVHDSNVNSPITIWRPPQTKYVVSYANL